LGPGPPGPWSGSWPKYPFILRFFHPKKSWPIYPSSPLEAWAYGDCNPDGPSLNLAMAARILLLAQGLEVDGRSPVAHYDKLDGRCTPSMDLATSKLGSQRPPHLPVALRPASCLPPRFVAGICFLLLAGGSAPPRRSAASPTPASTGQPRSHPLFHTAVSVQNHGVAPACRLGGFPFLFGCLGARIRTLTLNSQRSSVHIREQTSCPTESVIYKYSLNSELSKVLDNITTHSHFIVPPIR
jgi:hypothetical protein